MNRSVQQGAVAFINTNTAAAIFLLAEGGRTEGKHSALQVKTLLKYLISAMEVPGSDSDWRSPQFRQKVVAQM